MTKAPRNPIKSKRILNIIDTLTLEVWKYTGRGLNEKDKMLYTLLTALKIDLQRGNIKSSEFQIFIKGGAALDLNSVEPKAKKWITDMA
jgi:dynein heavy chain, axonemal